MVSILSEQNPGMDFLERCLFNLAAIGEIPKGKKISTYGECIQPETESYLPESIQRLSHADSRTKVLRTIRYHIMTVIEISLRIMESKYLHNNIDNMSIYARRITELERIYHALRDAKRGIIGQIDAYPGDADVKIQITDLITEIDRHMIILNKCFAEIGEKQVQ